MTNGSRVNMNNELILKCFRMISMVRKISLIICTIFRQFFWIKGNIFSNGGFQAPVMGEKREFSVAALLQSYYCDAQNSL